MSAPAAGEIRKSSQGGLRNTSAAEALNPTSTPNPAATNVHFPADRRERLRSTHSTSANGKARSAVLS